MIPISVLIKITNYVGVRETILMNKTLIGNKEKNWNYDNTNEVFGEIWKSKDTMVAYKVMT